MYIVNDHIYIHLIIYCCAPDDNDTSIRLGHDHYIIMNHYDHALQCVAVCRSVLVSFIGLFCKRAL